MKQYWNNFAAWTVCVMGFCLLAGCGGEEATTDSSSAGDPTPKASETKSNENSNPVTGWQEGPDGRPMLVDIPKDVWFPDPLGVVQEQGTIASNNTPVMQNDPGTTDPTPPVEPDPKPDPKPAAQTVVWSDLIPMAILDAEIKEDRNFLTTALQTVGKYNQNLKDIPPRAMTIAALAQVAMQHSEDTLWKDRAPAMRDLAVNLAYAADGTGRAPYAATTEQFEKIQEIFNGSNPVLDEPPDPEAAFADKADRGPLMLRINSAYEWLNANTPTASAVEKAKEKTVHETVIMATLFKVIADKSYYQADEPDYIQHIEETMEAMNQMEKSLETGDFDTFKQGLSIINRKCQECHGDYKDG